MRLFCLFSLLMMGLTLQAKAEVYKHLSCVIELEDPIDSERSIFKEYKVFGAKQRSGSWTFDLELNSIHSYYFRIRSGRPSPVYHTKAKFKMVAELINDELTYTTEFYNYAYHADQLMPLKTEERVIDLRDLDGVRKHFLNSEARLLDENTLGGAYVNQDGAKLHGCVLRNLDYKYYRSPWHSFGR